MGYYRIWGYVKGYIYDIKIIVMARKVLQVLVAEQKILNRIYVVRGEKVILDEDLAEMYGVETRRLNEQVKRNIKRFPKDFMFVLTPKEFESLMSQNATSSWGGRRKLPNAFTEQGVAMLSSVLNSDTAIEVNIRIIRVFTRLREYAFTHKEILIQLAKLEKEVSSLGRNTERNSKDIENIFLVLKELFEKDAKPAPRNKIGFKHYQ
ncbi:MAG TPA: ORF6N domain-containing protein [Ferruginibacter sp.]|nr:ORF6N domain-containing protein [Ferruginibacter sp.]HRO06783.1 ORF6N domain-containing protein [Ferruginibacter sp.]HRP50428.1 ORF6N domain-containing protein [Ferruginibacter sp.]